MIKFRLVGVSTLLLAGVFTSVNAAQLSSMDAATLKKYDGQNGQPAYVALNSYVYDVSKLPVWQGGHHYKGMHAGMDLSPYIDQSPHGPDIVKQLALPPVALYKNTK